MSFLRRLFATEPARAAAPATAATQRSLLVPGNDPLEVVGESFYQDSLRAIVGANHDYVRLSVEAVLVAETDNPYDRNAIAVWVDGQPVGHLSREDAEALRPGLLAMQRQHEAAITLAGVVVGGGEGRPSYGVFLDYDRPTFGLPELEEEEEDEDAQDEAHVGRRQPAGTIRTGLHNAIAQDAGNDAYDLSWEDRIPEDRLKAIAFIRATLKSESEPISRHFLFAELASRLYQAREQFGSALSEFDEVCRLHDAEMDSIRPALVTTFGGVPLLEVYKQSAIRHQKEHDWQAALWWAQRGLEVYGADALNPEFTVDLSGRIESYEKKLAPAPPRAVRVRMQVAQPTAFEVLVCRTCGQSFERERTRGRKPFECPSCRGVAEA